MSVKKYGLAAGFLAVAAGLLYWFDPVETHFSPICPFYVLTGLYCPGCGSTRAVYQLLHGNLLGALSMNPLMVVSLPILVLLCFRRNWTNRPWVAWCALVVLLSYGLLRNIEMWPFLLLAPG
jgi:hypothetical protein